MNRKPIQIRLDEVTIERLDRLAERLKRDHAGSEAETVFALPKPTRSDAIRAAILKGLDALEQARSHGSG